MFTADPLRWCDGGEWPAAPSDTAPHALSSALRDRHGRPNPGGSGLNAGGESFGSGSSAFFPDDSHARSSPGSTSGKTFTRSILEDGDHLRQCTGHREIRDRRLDAHAASTSAAPTIVHRQQSRRQREKYDGILRRYVRLHCCQPDSGRSRSAQHARHAKKPSPQQVDPRCRLLIDSGWQVRNSHPTSPRSQGAVC